MVRCSRRLVCSNETYEKLEQCRKVYRKHHPDLHDVTITQNMILDRVTEFYLRGETLEER